MEQGYIIEKGIYRLMPIFIWNEGRKDFCEGIAVEQLCNDISRDSYHVIAFIYPSNEAPYVEEVGNRIFQTSNADWDDLRAIITVGKSIVQLYDTNDYEEEY